MRNSLVMFYLIALFAYFPVEVQSVGDAPAQLCPSTNQPKLWPHLVIRTEAGTIAVELIERAAPLAIRQLALLVGGASPDPSPNAENVAPDTPGYYDGLVFDHAAPHVEIITSARPAEDSIELENELNAVALGLHEQRVENTAEAMSVVQQELLVTYRELKKGGQIDPKLKAWLDRWYKTYDAEFLIGVSRKEINEALGYVYSDVPVSLPVTRGAVSLKPMSPRRCSMRLSIALSDMRERDGRQVVVGRVVEGLAIAEAISARPLSDPALTHSRFRPAVPVIIETVRLECRARTDRK